MGQPILAPHRTPRPADAPFVFVSVADMRHSKLPNAIISTLGLGSCLGVTCYDPARRIGGLLHAMLPDSKKHRREDPIIAMYLDVGIPSLINGAARLGADPRGLEFKIYGGARILQSNDYFSVGRQNVEMMERLVEQHRLNVRHWDVGGQTNRSIDLYLADGRVSLRMPGKAEAWT